MAEYNKLDKSDKGPSQGLVNRRNAEIQLFSSPSAPIGYTPPPQTGQLTEKDKYEIEKDKQETAESQLKIDAASKRTLAIIDKYMTENGKPTNMLDDAVGFGEETGSWFGNIPFLPGGNKPQTIANQKELQLNLLENSILEASKALKPVSVDELKFLKNNRPAITDRPEVWTQYMQSIKDILSNPANYKEDPQKVREDLNTELNTILKKGK